MEKILEESLIDDPEMAFIDKIEKFDMRSIKILRADALKQLHEDKLCNSSIETITSEIRSKLLLRGEKSFTTLIR